MASRRTVIVTITQKHTGDMTAAVTSLKSHGLEVQQVLGTLGQVIGQAADDQLNELKSLDCVASVDAEQQYKAL
ncbi:hypothetical protein [Glutamicibacter sp. NPDC087344]|uniref:hypothetical protein n=1 Tax=Glutamicibacter sp. NPDC087344 TaxID=3363994 RepID=UPI00381F4450